MRRRARVDGPHSAIVQALRQVGCQVLDLSRVGEGCPDLLVRLPRKGLSDLWLMEVKTARGRLTPDQKRFHVYWPETLIVRSVSDALRAVGVEEAGRAVGGEP